MCAYGRGTDSALENLYSKKKGRMSVNAEYTKTHIPAFTPEDGMNFIVGPFIKGNMAAVGS